MPHPYLKEGMRVVITSGVMTGIEGILLRWQNRAKVIVSLDSISRALVIEVGEDSIQPAGNSRSQPHHLLPALSERELPLAKTHVQ
jgi:hypothetical protein